MGLGAEPPKKKKMGCFQWFSDGFTTNGFQPMVWVFGPWFSNSRFGIRVLEVSKDLILYCKHSI